MSRKVGRFTFIVAAVVLVSIYYWNGARGHRASLDSHTHVAARVQVPHRYPPSPPLSQPPTSPPEIPKPPDTISHAPSVGLLKSKTETLAALEPLFRPVAQSQLARDMVTHNRKVLEGLVECVGESSCTQYQSKVVILDAPNFALASLPTPQRDDYFERSALAALSTLGVSYVFSIQNSTWAVELHDILGSLVHGVIFQEGDHVYDLKKCFTDDKEEQDLGEGSITRGCVQSPLNPHGLPAWKIFAWSSDEFKHSPLGRPWSLVSEPFEGGETYIGFSLEEMCKTGVFPYVRHDQRSDPPRAWVHANLETYFVSHHNLWPTDWFEGVGNETGMRPVASLEPNVARLHMYPQIAGKKFVPNNLIELDRSKMSREMVMAEVAKSRLVVGLLDPKECPLPYEAFCMGVPYLNPVQAWDRDHPTDRKKWIVQNTVTKNLDPPYVYNVFNNDKEAFYAAFRGALEHPIDSFIPEPMSISAVQSRWAKFLEKDWKGEAVARNVLGPYTPGADTP